MPGLILSFILQRVQERRNAQAWLQRKGRNLQLGQAQYEWRRTQPYDFSQRSAPEKVPLFGSGSGFGLDYVQTRSVPAPVMGLVRLDTPKPIKRFSAANLQPLENSQRPYEDPAISRIFKPAAEGTDQKPLAHGGSPVANWDGQVRAFQRKPSFENAAPGTSGKKEPEPSIAQDPYSFY